MTEKALTKTSAKTLAALATYGETGVNWWAGIKGLDSRSEKSLLAAGLAERLTCQHGENLRCRDGEGHRRDHAADALGDTRWELRTRITGGGRQALTTI